MDPRSLQALALMQNALAQANAATNLILQELAEALERERQAKEPDDGADDDSL